MRTQGARYCTNGAARDRMSLKSSDSTEQFMTTETIITKPVAELLDRIARRERLEHDEWARAIGEAETDDLRRSADDLRRELYPDGVVTYVVDRNINYSNICFSVCNFC